MTHKHCTQDTKGYKHTHRIYITYCFATATMVARTRINITLYIRCLTCYILMQVAAVYLEIF